MERRQILRRRRIGVKRISGKGIDDRKCLVIVEFSSNVYLVESISRGAAILDSALSLSAPAHPQFPHAT